MRKKTKAPLFNSENFYNEREKITEVQKILAEIGKQTFPASFTDRVMTKINTRPIKTGLEFFYRSFIQTYRYVAFSGTVIILILILYNLHFGDTLHSEELMFASDNVFEEIINSPVSERDKE